MKVVYFTHSLASCWNHGNAHFLRGVLRELARRGHKVTAYEPANAWSLRNLLASHGMAGLEPFLDAYPELVSRTYDSSFEPADACADADLVIVHEWNEASLVAAVGNVRRCGGKFTLLFHDTHHRAVSDPQAVRAFDLDAYDGVLAFGEALAEVYRGWGWGRRVFVWHEAADTTLFRPPAQPGKREGLVWIGNWGDGERSAELETFLLRPARAASLALEVYGVRYPAEALDVLARHGARYRGWLANPRAPEIFARHLATIHVPRRFYVERLPGIPTIRVFEALACGIPLVSAPWRDEERLFQPGQDYLVARDGAEMARLLRSLQNDPARRAELVRAGLRAIRSRHSCEHRVDQLLEIVRSLKVPAVPAAEVAG